MMSWCLPLFEGIFIPFKFSLVLSLPPSPKLKLSHFLIPLQMENNVKFIYAENICLDEESNSQQRRKSICSIQQAKDVKWLRTACAA